jgi:diaminobutyrate-2-oxoglutarate transaminase
VSTEMKSCFDSTHAPYLLADLPDGATLSTERAMTAAEQMLGAGAEALKVEVIDANSLSAIEALCTWGVPVVAHLGYTPQRGQLTRYGDLLTDAYQIFARARSARDAGASAIVLEMVSEAVNRALSWPRRGSLPIYSIFSGRAPYGAQSLNVWDAVFHPPGVRKYFPPTAELVADGELDRYTPSVIAGKLDQLLRMTLAGDFPLSPPSRMSTEDLRILRECDPWMTPSSDRLPAGPTPGSRLRQVRKIGVDSRAAEDPLELESSVRVYCRKFPAVFTTARHHLLRDEQGREYIDFISGAGSLNYGHNHPAIVGPMLQYLRRGGIVQGMDLHTTAKREFIRTFQHVILEPRALDYRLQFTGPTGTNAIEAAFKLARTVTGRTEIIAFTNGFHGMTLGALAATATPFKRAGAGVPLPHVTRMPYDGYLGPGIDTMDVVTAFLDDHERGVDLPAAFVVETVQGEGGLYTASTKWLNRLATLARERGILLIVDDIQTGSGRTGTFFGFENANLYPDLVCLSKSLGGIGLPVALLLVKPEFDGQRPGEHSGTFRGNNLAFVAGTAALSMWSDPRFEQNIGVLSALLDRRLRSLAEHDTDGSAEVRGRGLMMGIAWADGARAARISTTAFGLGLLAETCGPFGNVLKVMPPLTIADDALHRGLDILEEAVLS